VSVANVSGLVVANAYGTTGTSFEAGQTNAVVTLFTNMRNEMATWNTKTGDLLSPAKAYTITFNVANGPTIANFGQDGYNPFIYNTTRGNEIHLAGKTPTKLADVSLFGTADDNTSISASRYYVTKTGLPYAISVPVVPFNYPTEGTDITKAYLHFADWAAAGGTKYTDWYSNTALDYRTTANIFK
jgi:LruC domain-containing protein